MNRFNLSFDMVLIEKANTEQQNGKLKISFRLHVIKNAAHGAQTNNRIVKMCFFWLGIKFKQRMAATAATANWHINARISKRLNASFTIQMANEFQISYKIRIANASPIHVNCVCVCVRVRKRIYYMAESFQCIFLWLCWKAFFFSYFSRSISSHSFYLFYAHH